MDICVDICIEKKTNATIRVVGMLLSSHTIKSRKSIEKIQPRMMCTTCHGNPFSSVISCYSPTNVSDETDVITFYNELSSLVQHIPKYNVLIIFGRYVCMYMQRLEWQKTIFTKEK